MYMPYKQTTSRYYCYAFLTAMLHLKRIFRFSLLSSSSLLACESSQFKTVQRVSPQP